MPFHFLRTSKCCLGAFMLLSALLLGACGGGGGGSSAAPAVTYPASGYYLPVFRSLGFNKVGLSLLHASTPDVEYVVSPPGSSISSSWVLYSMPSAGGGYLIQPSYLLYIQGGTFYDLPLVAAGSKPQTVPVSIGATACLILDAHTANTAPQDSQVIVSTAGLDGVCGSGDDGQVRVNLALPLSSTTVQNLGYKYKGYVYSGTPQPNIWLETDSAGALYKDESGTPVLLRASTGSMPLRVARSGSSLLLQDGNQLSMVFNNGAAWQVVNVAGTTGTWAWAGSDNGNYYVYTSGGTTTSAWQLLAIPIGGSTSTVLASGTGAVSSAAIGNSHVFVSVQGVANNYLYMVATSGLSSPVVDTTATSIRDQVYVLGGGRHILYRAQYSGNTFVTGQVNSIDESGTIVSLSPKAIPANFVIPASVAAGASGLPMQLSFVAYAPGVADFSGAQVETFDSATATLTSNGTLPSAASLGISNLYWSSSNAFSNSAGIFTAAADATGLLASGSHIFYYNPSVAGSLTQTTLQY